MELSEIHDCEKCHNKIVMISIDKLGITRCGYCNEIVNYKPFIKMNHFCKHGMHGSDECKCLRNDQQLFFDCDECKRYEYDL